LVDCFSCWIKSTFRHYTVNEKKNIMTLNIQYVQCTGCTVLSLEELSQIIRRKTFPWDSDSYSHCTANAFVNRICHKPCTHISLCVLTKK
jgi:hypothetical protein